MARKKKATLRPGDAGYQTRQARQGDVLVSRIKGGIPEGATLVEHHNTPIILAEGEVTGHAHRILSGDVEEYSHNGDMYLKVNKDAQVIHEEHGPLFLTPGEYKVIRQVEVWMDEVRQVAD